jgi:hypothetical protein
MRKLLWPLPSLFLLASGVFQQTAAQVTSTITVQGSLSDFYPVAFKDSIGFYNNVLSQLVIGRPYGRQNSAWRSSRNMIWLKGGGATYQLSSNYNLISYSL